jgi:hypothetical protein
MTSLGAAREIIAALVAGGMDVVDAAALVARSTVEMNVIKPPSKAALRTQKWRATKASQTVTRDVTNESVTERHIPSPVTIGDVASLSTENKIQENKKKEGERHRGCRLPENWDPSIADFEAAVAAIGYKTAVEQLARFRDHWKLYLVPRG